MRRYGFLCALMVGIVFSPVTWQPVMRAAAAHGYAGSWHLSYLQRCDNTLENQSACTVLWGEDTPTFGVPTTSWQYRETDNLSVDAQGNAIVHGVAVITERVANRGPRCSESVWSLPFTGTCTVTYAEHWYVRKGKTGLLDFWGKCTLSDTFTYTGHAPSHPATCLLQLRTQGDTLYPARPGNWNTKQYAALFRLKHVPAGVRAELTITRH